MRSPDIIDELTKWCDTAERRRPISSESIDMGPYRENAPSTDSATRTRSGWWEVGND